MGGAHGRVELELSGCLPGGYRRGARELRWQVYTVSPLTDAELLESFGTLTPTGDEVGKGGTLGSRRRWQGAYVISYNGDTPTEIHFYGFSGD